LRTPIEEIGVTKEHPIIAVWSFVDDPNVVLYRHDGITFSGTLSLFPDGVASNTHLTMRGHRRGNWRIDGDQLYLYLSEEMRGSFGLGAGLPGLWTFSISNDGKTLTLKNDETKRTFTRLYEIHEDMWWRFN